MPDGLAILGIELMYGERERRGSYVRDLACKPPLEADPDDVTLVIEYLQGDELVVESFEVGVRTRQGRPATESERALGDLVIAAQALRRAARTEGVG